MVVWGRWREERGAKKHKGFKLTGLALGWPRGGCGRSTHGSSGVTGARKETQAGQDGGWVRVGRSGQATLRR